MAVRIGAHDASMMHGRTGRGAERPLTEFIARMEGF